MARIAASITAIVVLVIALAGCGSISLASPEPTPTSFPGLTGRLATAGITVAGWVSGDAGCQSDALAPAAISFQASGLDQATPVRVYLYIFRDRPAWERHRAEIGPCAQSYVTDASSFREIEQSPYIVAGQGPWGATFEAVFRDVLAGAAGTGG